jgi:predicted transcriptional regulator
MAEARTTAELTARIVAAYVARNSIGAADLGELIGTVSAALVEARKGKSTVATGPLVPFVSIKKSITPDFMICLDDGRRFKSLTRHLRTLGMTPDQYRAKWGLPESYPMVAPSYSAARSSLAKSNGFGGKAGVLMGPNKKRGRKKPIW